jgi:Flp pilus assembly protein TadD
VGADALLGLGLTALEQGDVRMATTAFEHLAQAAPSADAYRGLITCYRNAGRGADAERALEEARRMFPADPSLTALPGAAH